MSTPADDLSERPPAQAVVDALPGAFVTTDLRGRIVTANREGERLLGPATSSRRPRVLWDLLPAEVSDLFRTRCREASRADATVAFECYLPAPTDAWFDVHVRVGEEALSFLLLEASTRHARHEAVLRDAERLGLLADLSEALAVTSDADDAMHRLLDVVVPTLADWSVVTLAEEDGFRDVAVAHRDPSRLDDVRAYAAAQAAQRSPDAPFWQILGGEPFHTAEIHFEVIERLFPDPATRALLARLDPTSGTAVPLTARGRGLGVLGLWNSGSRPEHTPEEIRTAVDLGRRAGLTLDNTRLATTQRRISEALQRSLLTTPPPMADLDIAVRYRPAAEAVQVGGDWYDAFRAADGSSCLVIGDVAGHDGEAAAAMAQVRNLLRGIAFTLGQAPAPVLTALDRAMAGLGAGTLATAVLATVGAGNGAGAVRLRWSNAGHPPPVLIGTDGTVELLEAPVDLLLGFDPGTERLDHEVQLAPGATVLFYTDGLVERRGAGLDEGLHWLTTTVAGQVGATLDDLCDALLDAIGDTPSDDVALLAVRPLAPGAGRSARGGPRPAR